MKTYRIEVRETHLKTFEIEVPLYISDAGIAEAFLNNYPQAADAIDSNMESCDIISKELTATFVNQGDIDILINDGMDTFWQTLKDSLPDNRNYNGVPAGVNNDLRVSMQKAIETWAKIRNH